MPRSKSSRPAAATAALLLLLPAAAARAGSLGRILLRWERVQSASSYDVELATDAGFERPALRVRVPTNSYAWTDLPSVEHFWRVRSVDREGRAGSWSPGRAIAPVFVTPTLAQPDADATFRAGTEPLQIELQCRHVPGATAYAIEVATDPAFHERVLLHRASDCTAQFLPSVAGRFYWRAQAQASHERATSFTEPRSFAVASRIESVGPPSGFTVTRGQLVTLTWQSNPKGRAYHVDVARDLEMTRIVLSRTTQNESVAWPAAEAGTYFWRVTVRDGSQNPMSTAALDVHVLPLPPQARMPADGWVAEPSGPPVPAVELSWSSEPGAAGYLLEVSDSEEFALGRLEQRGGSAATQTLALSPGTYFWRVRALTADGSAGEASATRVFSVSAPPPPPLPPQPTPPAQQVAGVRPPHAVPPIVLAAPMLSLFSNLGAVLSPKIGFELGLRSGWLGRRVGLALRVGYFSSRTDAGGDGASLATTSRLHGVPVDLLAVVLHDTRLVGLVLGLGLETTFSYVSVHTETQPTYASGAVDLALLAQGGVERAIGPGLGFLQLSYARAQRGNSLVERDLGGLALEGGYRFRLW